MQGSRAFPGAHHPDVGARLGPYQVLSVLGEGGMSRVLLAEHLKLGRKVAIKRLKPEAARGRAAVQRFFEEARTVARLRHPHIVEVTDLVEEEGEVYAVMELLEGQSVADAIALEGQLSRRRALHIAYQTAQALEAAHDAGVVHLDVKPANLFLAAHHAYPDFVKLLDFGVAHLVPVGPSPAGQDAPEPAAPSSPPGGTPAYLSPEQAAGGPLGPRSDLYSLGVTLFEMLSGRLPFRADGRAGYVYQHQHEPAPRLLDLEDLPEPVPAPCSDLVTRLLAKDPAERPESARALALELKRVARQVQVELRPAAAPRSLRAARPRWRPTPLAGALGVAGLVVVTALLILWHPWAPTPGSTQGATAASPSTPRRVTLTVRSLPPHADVVRVSPTRRPLGVTPLHLTLSSPRAPWVLELRLAGYVPRRVSVTLDRDQGLVVDLTPLARSGAVRPAARPDSLPTRRASPGPRLRAWPRAGASRVAPRAASARSHAARRRASSRPASRDQIVDPFVQ